MKLYIPLVFCLGLCNTSFAAPLRLHNRIVFTRDDKAKQNETVWTMNSDGGEQRRVWRVPKGYGQFGGFSRDGKQALSFNGFSIYLHNLATKRFKRITSWNGSFGSYIKSPSFSADAKQIIYEAGGTSANSPDSHIFKIAVRENPLPFMPKELPVLKSDVPTDNLWGGSHWSEDGKKIVAVGGPSYSFGDYYSPSSPVPTSQIWVMNSDGTGAHQLTSNSAWNVEPDWSRDGKRIIFVRRLKTSYSDLGVFSSNLVLLDAVSGAEKPLTSLAEKFDDLLGSQLPPVVSKPLFSPEGTQIAFEESTNADQIIGIYRIDVDGKNQKRLSDGQLVQWIP